MITGLNSTGVDVADLRVLPAAVSRHLLKTQGYDAGVHVGVEPRRPGGASQIRFFEQPGIQLTPALAEGDREALHPPGAPARRLRRRRERSAIRPACARATRRTCSRALDVEAIRERGLPDRRRLRLLGRLVRAAARARAARGRGGLARTAFAAEAPASRATAARGRSARRSGSSTAVGADLGVVFDRGRRAPLPGRRAGARDPGRAGAAALPAPDRLATAARASSPSRSP